MPRPRDAVRDRFTEVVVNGITHAQCKFCNIEMVSLVARMKQHAESCRKRTCLDTTDSTDSGPSGRKKLKQSTISGIATSRTKQNKINLQIARCVSL